MRHRTIISPYERWAASLTRVLLWPVLISLLLGVALAITDIHWLGLAIFGSVIAMVVHFVSYLIIGIPFYLCFWSSFPKLWRWEIGLPIGSILGALAVLALVFSISDSVETWSDIMVIGVVGGAYGLTTAAATITSRRKKIR